MSSSVRPGSRSAGSAPSQRSTRPAAAPTRARSTAQSTAPTAEPPRVRASSSRLASTPAAVAPPSAPSLQDLTTLYASLHNLATLRSTSRASDDLYRSTIATLKRELERLETEVGESRERRKVENELELLSEVQKDEALSRLLARCVEGLGRSAVLLEGIERGTGSSEGIYPLQLLLAECSTKLGRLNLSASSQLATLLPSLQSLVDLRIQLLTANRAKLEQTLAVQRSQVATKYDKLAATSLD